MLAESLRICDHIKQLYLHDELDSTRRREAAKNNHRSWGTILFDTDNW